VSRHSVDGAWLDAELGELERLVAEGDTLELVGRLAAAVREPRLAETETGAATATPASETV